MLKRHCTTRRFPKYFPLVTISIQGCILNDFSLCPCPLSEKWYFSRDQYQEHYDTSTQYV